MSSKYTSIQNECLDLIEAYSEEQYHAEMAVIDSVLDMFDKISCLMEYSNPDNISIPDCSMFMESTFFQEADPLPTGNGQSEGGNPSVDNKAQTQSEPQQQQNPQNQTNDNNNQTNPTTNREQYNKDHPFRKMNDKGKIENIFISILKFIPRLIALPIRMLISYIKKKKNNNASETMKNMTEEQRQKIAEEIKKHNGETTGNGCKIENNNITSENGGETVSFNVDNDSVDFPGIPDADKIEEQITNIENGLKDVTAESLTSTQPLIPQQPEETNEEKEAQRMQARFAEYNEKRIRTMENLQKSLKRLQQCEQRLNQCINELEQNGALANKERTLPAAIKARKGDLLSIKRIIVGVNARIKNLENIDTCTENIVNTYIEYYNKIKGNDPVEHVEKYIDQNMNALEKNKAGNSATFKGDSGLTTTSKGGNNNG